MSPAKSPFETVQFTDAAMDDLRALQEKNPVVLREAFRLLKQLDAGELQPRRLENFGKTGDLRDCGKIVVAPKGEPEHRIVVRDLDGSFHVSEVVVVDNRVDDLPYLLAAVRLDRLEDPIRRSDAARRIHRVRKLLDDT